MQGLRGAGAYSVQCSEASGEFVPSEIRSRVTVMPQLAAFPKAWLDDLCVTGKMTIRQWVQIGSTLGVDGLEFYSGFLDLRAITHALEVRRLVEDFGLTVPMFCCSPDFTHPDPNFRQQQI